MNRINKKGQIGVIGIMVGFIMLIMLSALMPTIVTTISNTTPVVDSSTGVMLSLIPLVFVATLIGSILIYARPTY